MDHFTKWWALLCLKIRGPDYHSGKSEIGGIPWDSPNGLQKILHGNRNQFINTFLPRIFFGFEALLPRHNLLAIRPPLVWEFLGKFRWPGSMCPGFIESIRQSFRFFKAFQCRPKTSGHLVCLQRHVPFGVSPLYRLQLLARACQTCWGRPPLAVWKFDLEPFFHLR